ncbi:MAG: glycosyltransferase N-terminal domain-containing protein [Ginsengibacter sp.]
MSLLLYNLFLALYKTGVLLLSIWNSKARLWIKGRKTFPKVDYSSAGHNVVWMHCASLGEFEQGRPLLEEIKLYYRACKIVVTFFSPSGYEIRKGFNGADHVFYLPHDSPRNAQKFIGEINPSLVIWIKYEYWYYYLYELRKKNIPVLLVSGVFRENMPFFKWYGYLWKKMLACFVHFFVQNQQSKNILERLVSADKITSSGDTRFDRVITIAEKFEHISAIENFCGNSQVIVAGSTWEDDEAEWTHYVKSHPEIKFIIAPHEIDKENLAFVKKQFPGSIFYSEWMRVVDEKPEISSQRSEVRSKKSLSNCLIIDNIGMLSRLYYYASVCFVGGGFGYEGLHNILEAAVYGKPVIFGPEYEKNFEAVEMIERGGAISIENAIELEKVLNKLLSDEVEIKRRGEASKKYVYTQSGATKIIIDFIQKNLLLTN